MPFALRERSADLRRLAIAAAAALLTLGTVGWFVWPVRVAAPVHPTFDGGDGYGPGRQLQRDAWAAYRAERYQACLDRLDDAMAFYPAGERQPDVRWLRQHAMAALAPRPDAGVEDAPGE